MSDVTASAMNTPITKEVLDKLLDDLKPEINILIVDSKSVPQVTDTQCMVTKFNNTVVCTKKIADKLKESNDFKIVSSMDIS